MADSQQVISALVPLKQQHAVFLFGPTATLIDEHERPWTDRSLTRPAKTRAGRRAVRRSV